MTNTTSSKILQIPRALKPGDCVAVVSPAGPSKPEDLEQGLLYLSNMGYQPKLMPYAHESRYYLAGSDQHRLSDLHQAFIDPDVKAILSARGGYGCMRLLPNLDWDLIAQHPKVLIGFSDLTSLLIPCYEQTGLVGFHGPMLTSNLLEHDRYTQSQLWAMVSGQQTYPYTFENKSPYTCLNPGIAQGPLIGGNLSLLAAMCGTPYQPNTQGHVVFIEDWHESFYSIDRQWTQLKLAGFFDNIAGLLFGDFLHIEHPWPDYSLEQLFRELTAFLKVPVGFGLSVGHGDQLGTLPIGMPCVFDAESGHLKILSSPVRP